ncbi:MAG: hypothetical protein JWO20_1284 [Candidatus Angelobacter sp.]|jgi:hypothetical protein|nr:hypothetical protein [Candidatus Angelobacter sp.]
MGRLLLIIVFLGTSGAPAQTSQAAPSQKGKGNASQVSVQGCLSGSNGSYLLTDKTGNTYQLTGIAADLSSHVGQQVKITGSAIPSSAATASETTETAETAPTRRSSSEAQPSKITVENVTKVSDHCSPGR